MFAYCAWPPRDHFDIQYIYIYIYKRGIQKSSPILSVLWAPARLKNGWQTGIEQLLNEH